MKRYVCLAALVALVVLIGSFYAPSPALSEPYFKGKKITIVIASGPGGRKDRITRTVVRYLSKYIPGKPQFRHAITKHPTNLQIHDLSS